MTPRESSAAMLSFHASGCFRRTIGQRIRHHERTKRRERQATAAEAAGFIRTGAIVSLQTVVGEAGITNNFPDIVTSVVPHERGHVVCAGVKDNCSNDLEM
jgi:hypothetical protein